MTAAVWLGSGMLMGLASSMHCAAMCGAISTSFLLLTQPQPGVRNRLSTLMAAQAGRMTSYAAAGALVGFTGTRFLDLLDRADAFRLLQMAAAAALVWIGLSVAGLLPQMARLDPVLQPLTRTVLRAQTLLFGAGSTPPFVAGLFWGMIPCAMVFGALFVALMTGTPTGGLLLMTGFGLGTLPSVTAAAIGVTRLRDQARSARLRCAVGLGIVALGLGSLGLSAPGGLLCATPAGHAAVPGGARLFAVVQPPAPLAAGAARLNHVLKEES